MTNSGYIDESVHDAREQWLQDGGWRTLGRGDGEMGMEELDSETAKLIIVREEMDLTPKDKVCQQYFSFLIAATMLIETIRAYRGEYCTNRYDEA